MKITKALAVILLSILISSETVYAQDWANLGKFREDNAKVEVPAADENRVVFMGNSITIGWGNYNPGFFTENPYINRGISGQTTPQMLLRFRADVIDLDPEIVVILAGTNDIAENTGPITPEEIVGNIASMSELARANDIKVILCSVLPAFDYRWKPGMEPAGKIVSLNAMIKHYAKENNIRYLDYFSAMVDDRNGLPEKYSGDGVHPNKEGYNVMEPLVQKAIKKEMKKK
jgi:lysophospholipase L1-like esterase